MRTHQRTNALDDLLVHWRDFVAVGMTGILILRRDIRAFSQPFPERWLPVDKIVSCTPVHTFSTMDVMLPERHSLIYKVH